MANWLADGLVVHHKTEERNTMSSYTVQVNSITCVSKSDPPGSADDEVWLFCQPDAGVPIRYPYGGLKTHSMAPGDIWVMDGSDDNSPILKIPFEYDVLITLWDQDLPLDIGLTDFLGCHDFTAASTDDSEIEVTNGDSSEYLINWSRLQWGT